MPRGWASPETLKLIPAYDVEGGLLMYKPATMLVQVAGIPYVAVPESPAIQLTMRGQVLENELASGVTLYDWFVFTLGPFTETLTIPVLTQSLSVTSKYWTRD